MDHIWINTMNYKKVRKKIESKKIERKREESRGVYKLT